MLASISMFFAGALSAAPLQLALNWKPEPQFGGFYEMNRQKFDEKMGFKVQILEGGTGTPTLQLLTNKKVDAAVVSADEIVVAHDRGNTDVVAVFAVYQTNPQGLMFRKTGAKLSELLQDPQNTLLWQSGLPYALYLSKKYSIKAKQAPTTGGVSVFLKDPRVLSQVFVTSEPLLAKKQGVDVQTFLVADEGFNPYTTVLAVRKSTLQSNPDMVRKLVSAVRLGWTAYLKDPAATNQMMSQMNPGMSPEAMKESALAQVSLIENKDTERHGLGSMSKERWSQLSSQLKASGLIKSTPPADALMQVF